MNEQKNQLQKQFNVLLIGDNCVDVYQFGTIDRLSPEAPVPVFVPTYNEEHAGMVGNVYANLVKMGCNVNLLCGQTSKKTRLIDQRSKQQIVRIDEDIKSIPIEIESELSDYDAIVISDYNKGVVNYELITYLINHAKNKNIPIFIDTKKTNLNVMQGAWVKINELEYSKITSHCTGLIVTRGSEGAELIDYNFKVKSVPVNAIDVTGAGDTFLAALTYMFLKSDSIITAIDFANKAAAITVQHIGCYAPSLDEIK